MDASCTDKKSEGVGGGGGGGREETDSFYDIHTDEALVHRM